MNNIITPNVHFIITCCPLTLLNGVPSNRNLIATNITAITYITIAKLLKYAYHLLITSFIVSDTTVPCKLLSKKFGFNARFKNYIIKENYG